MNHAVEAPGFQFEFQVTRAEDRVFRALTGKNLSALMDRRITKGAPLVVCFLIIVWACTAVDRGWQTPGAAFGSLAWFLLGYFFAFVLMVWCARQMFDRMFELNGAAQVTWQVALDDVWIVVRKAGSESRMPWKAITAVKDSDTLVALCYDARIGFFIPARVFGDSASRAAFAEWASERVRSAASLASETPVKSSASPADT